MASRVPIPAVVPPSPRRLPGWTRIAAVPGVAGLVVLAFWLGGGKLTDDFALSLLLTAVLVGAVGAAALAAALRWRQLALPLLATFVVSSGSIGGYLAYATFDDTVVDEQVVVAPPAGEAAAGGPTELAAGTFGGLAHETTGRAALVELPDGSLVVTLTGFETDAGPDLRVYLAPGTGGDVADALDLGALRGNIGDQQYPVPADADPSQLRSVVIWCRAFSVAFGAAELVPA